MFCNFFIALFIFICLKWINIIKNPILKNLKKKTVVITNNNRCWSWLVTVICKNPSILSALWYNWFHAPFLQRWSLYPTQPRIRFLWILCCMVFFVLLGYFHHKTSWLRHCNLKWQKYFKATKKRVPKMCLFLVKYKQNERKKCGRQNTKQLKAGQSGVDGLFTLVCKR